MRIHPALTTLLLTCTSAPTNAQSTVASRVWGTPNTDYFLGARADGTDLVVYGASTRPGTGDDVLLVKLTTGGAFVWGKTWSLGMDDLADGFALDASANIYLTGTSTSIGPAEDGFVLSYAPDGTLRWQRAWGGALEDTFCGATVDAGGDVYAGGGTRTHALDGRDTLLVKYGPSGALLWARTWDAGPEDSFNAIEFAGGPGGGIYGAGNTINVAQGTFRDMLVVKYSSSGAVQWARSWGGLGNDDAFGLAVDDSAGVYAWGVTDSGAGGARDMVVVKWDAQGNKLWELTWGGPGDDEPSGLHPVAGGGSFYLLGSTPQCGGGPDSDVLIAFFDELPAPDQPQLKWARAWSGTQEEFLGGIHIDGNRLYAGGATETCMGTLIPCTGLIDDPDLDVPLGSTQTASPSGQLANPAGSDITLGDAGCGSAFDALLLTLEVPIGRGYGCGPTQPNTTGVPGVLLATGSASVAANAFGLTATQLPPAQFGYFLAGRTPGFFSPPGSAGFICLSGNIGRFNQAANIIQGPMGSIAVDLNAIPVNPTSPVQVGETWHFQCWYRDSGTSNFTDAVAVTFQ
ncbi:MAG: hypothetical protein GY711_24275 [bacterium]|nr:hypothetical protein [bacterium]